MTAASTFWTPYRRGALVALCGWAIGLVAAVALFAMVLNTSELALWVFLATIPLAAIISPMIEPSISERGGFASCPSCGKSVLLMYGWTSGKSIFSAQLWWPERECSECLHDLTESGLA
jgi:hypothetical protein